MCEEVEHCTLQYEINTIRKYKMSHINKMVNSQIETENCNLCHKLNKNKQNSNTDKKYCGGIEK